MKQFKVTKTYLVTANTQEEAEQKVRLFHEVDDLYEHILREAKALMPLLGRPAPTIKNIKIKTIDDAIRKLREMNQFYEKNEELLNKILPGYGGTKPKKIANTRRLEVLR